MADLSPVDHDPFGIEDADATGPLAMPPVVQKAFEQYPVLLNLNASYKMSPGQGGSNLLEYYAPDEADRPKDFPAGRPGVEIYSDKVTPQDILGDALTHGLRISDPVVKHYYDTFSESITPQQEVKLKEQYRWAKDKEGESRPYEQWREVSGVPAWVRGQAVKQWPDEFIKNNYTPDQIKNLDDMMGYVSGSARLEPVEGDPFAGSNK